jgi:hypothetical protein
MGIFFWSEGGPALFDGSKVRLMVKRMKALLDTVDWTTNGQARICSSYDPYRRFVFVSYRRSGQTNGDRTLIIDLKTLKDDGDVVFWPVLFGHSAMCQHEDSNGRLRPHFGTQDGYVLMWDDGTTWNNSTITPRARSRIYHLGRPDMVLGMRTVDLWSEQHAAGTIVLRYAADGATSFTTHAASGAMLESGKDISFNRFKGNGSGAIVPGRLLQLEATTSGVTNLNIYGWEIGVEPLSKRTL